MAKAPKTTTAPTGQIAPFGLRMLPDLKEKIEQAARESGRSMNAEIVARLESSFQGPINMDMTFKMLNAEVQRLTDELRDIRSASSPLMAKIGQTVESQVRYVMERFNLSFEEALLMMTTRGMAMSEAAPAVVVQVAKGTTLSEARDLMLTIGEQAPHDAHLFYESADNVQQTRLLTTEADKAALLTRVKPSKPK